MSEWVPVVAAGVGAVPGLVTARWALGSARRLRRDDLVKSAVANLLTEAGGATFLPVNWANPVSKRFVTWRPSIQRQYVERMQTHLRALVAAKTEFDLIIDSQAMHDAADELIEAVNGCVSLPAFAASPEQIQEALDRVRDARLRLVHEARRTLPALVTDRRSWRRLSNSR